MYHSVEHMQQYKFDGSTRLHQYHLISQRRRLLHGNMVNDIVMVLRMRMKTIGALLLGRQCTDYALSMAHVANGSVTDDTHISAIFDQLPSLRKPTVRVIVYVYTRHSWAEHHPHSPLDE
jgi:hypothetical protein